MMLYKLGYWLFGGTAAPGAAAESFVLLADGVSFLLLADETGKMRRVAYGHGQQRRHARGLQSRRRHGGVMMLIPSSVIAPRAASRNTSLLSQISDFQALFDLDATLAASYGGSGQAWANLIAAPDDGSAQTAYDFHRGANSSSDSTDPAFNGSANDAAAYWSIDGGDYFRCQSALTAAMKNLHKTTGGAPATYAMAFRTPGSLTSTYAFGTSAQSSGDGVIVRYRSTGEVNLFQMVNGATNSSIVASSGALAANTDYLLFITMDFTGGTCSSALNARTLTSKTLTSAASTTNADGNLEICAGGSGTTILTGGYRIYDTYLFNKVLTNADVSAAVDVLNSRHNRAYA